MNLCCSESLGLCIIRNHLERSAWTYSACLPQGENAWVFVPEEEIATAVKHYFKFEEDVFTEAKKQAAKNQEVKAPTELSCAVMSGKYLTPAEVRYYPSGVVTRRREMDGFKFCMRYNFPNNIPVRSIITISMYGLQGLQWSAGEVYRTRLMIAVVGE